MNEREKQLMRNWIRELTETDKIFDWIKPKMMADKLVELKQIRRARLQIDKTRIETEISELL